MQLYQILRVVALLCLLANLAWGQSNSKSSNPDGKYSQSASPFDDLPTFSVTEFGAENQAGRLEPPASPAYPVSATKNAPENLYVRQFPAPTAERQVIDTRMAAAFPNIVVTETNPYANQQYFNPVVQGAPAQTMQPTGWPPSHASQDAQASPVSYTQIQPATAPARSLATAQPTASVQPSEGFSVMRLFRSMTGRSKPPMPHAAPIPMPQNTAVEARSTDIATYGLSQSPTSSNPDSPPRGRSPANGSLHRWWGGTGN